MPDEMLVMGTLPAVRDHPGPTENVWCEAGKRNIPVRSEEMTSVCLFPRTVLPGTHQQAEMIDIKWERLDHQCGRVGTPIVITARIHTFVGIAGV